MSTDPRDDLTLRPPPKTKKTEGGKLKGFFSRIFLSGKSSNGPISPSAGGGDGSAIKGDSAIPNELVSVVDKLKKQNLALSTKLAKLRAKAVRDDILSGREMELEEEVEFLKRRIRELKEKQKVLLAQWKRLPAAMETIATLRARNSFLTVKVERQKEMIGSMAGKNSKGEELSNRVKELANENMMLREQIGSQAILMEEMSEKFSSSEMAETFQELLQTNRTIEQNINSQPLDMGKIEGEKDPDNLLAAMDSLDDENMKLKEILKSREKITSLACGQSMESIDMQQTIQGLKEENLHLQMAFAEKVGRLEAFERPLAINLKLQEKLRLHKSQKERLEAKLNSKERQVQELREQIHGMNTQLGTAEEVAKKNNELKIRLEQAEKYITVLKAFEVKYKKLKGEFTSLETRHQSTLSLLNEMTSKTARLTAAYEQLTEEYEKLFESL